MFTYFDLTVRKVKDLQQFNEICKALEDKDLTRYVFWTHLYDCDKHEGNFNYFDCVQWINHVEDMVMIAEKFPNVYFELECRSEDCKTFWKEYYHDMDIEVCQGEIVYEQPKKVQWTELITF